MDFPKVPAKIAQTSKGLILSQKRLISNRRNFCLLAPKSMHFPSKDRKSEDLFFNRRNFSQAIFLFSQNALEKLYYSVILTASSGQFLSCF